MGPEAIFFVSLFGLSVTFFVFYFCFEPFRHYFQKRRHGFSYSLVKEEEDRQVQSATTSDEFESFVYDEYHTQDHEILVVSMSNRSQSVSICAFLQERKFEYFCQELPTCCQEEPSANLDNAKIKVSFTALSFWCQKWALAAKCVLLSDSKKFVSETWEKTGDIGKKIKHYQDQYFFNINAQWTLNYLCEEVRHIFFFTIFAQNLTNFFVVRLPMKVCGKP